MKQLTLDLKIKRDVEIDEIDLWDFDNFNWLTGSPESLEIFFTDAIPRINKMISKFPDQKRYRKLMEDCRRRLDEIKANSKINKEDPS